MRENMDIVMMMWTQDGETSFPLAPSHASHPEESPPQGHHAHHSAGYDDCKDAFDADFNNFHGNHYYRDRQFLTPTPSNLWRKAAGDQGHGTLHCQFALSISVVL